MSAPTRDELEELRSFTVSTVNDALRLLNVKDSLLDYIAALEAHNQQLREALERFISVATDAMPWQEHLDAAVVQARAALAATNEEQV